MFPGFWQPSLCGGPGLWREPMPEHGGDGEKQIVWSLLGSWLHAVEAEPQLSPSVGRCFWRQPLSWRALTLCLSPAAHQNRVSAIIFSLAAEWVISTGHDKCVSWMCTRSGNMLGRHFFASWASCLQYPSECRTPSSSHLTPHCWIWNWTVSYSEGRMIPVDLT